jgi:integrase
VVYQRGKTWWYDFWLNGKRYAKGIKTARNRTQAKEEETKARAQILDGTYGQIDCQSFRQFVTDTYLPFSETNKKSHQSDDWRSNVLIAEFGDLKLDEISPFGIEKFKKARREGKTRTGVQRSAASVNRDLELLSAILSLAFDYSLIKENPCRKVRKFPLSNRRTRYLDPTEEKRLLAVCDGRREHLKWLVILALNTGMRRGELLRLRAEDVDLARGRIYVSQTKTDRPRYVPINQTTHDVFLILLARTKTGRFFKMDEIKTAWWGALRDAEIKNFRFHDLRHTFATRIADSGADVFTIASLLGHSSIVMAGRYTHATDQGKREAVKALTDSHSFPTSDRVGLVRSCG